MITNQARMSSMPMKTTKPVAKPVAAAPAAVVSASAPAKAVAAPVAAPTKTTKVAAPVAVAPVAAPVVPAAAAAKVEEAAPAAAAAPAKRTTKAVKAAEAAAAAPVVEVAAAAAAPEPAAATAAPAEDAVDHMKTFDEIAEEMSSLETRIRELRKKLATARKHVARDLKEAARGAKRGGRRTRAAPVEGAAPRALGGFQKPANITNELADFLSLPHGTQISRVEVVKSICAYVKEHNLQDSANKRNIVPDARLQALLNPDKQLSYFNLQHFLSAHFPKAAAAAGSA